MISDIAGAVGVAAAVGAVIVLVTHKSPEAASAPASALRLDVKPVTGGGVGQVGLRF